MFTSQNNPYLQKHSGVPRAAIATLKRVFFVEPLGGGWWSEPPGKYGKGLAEKIYGLLFNCSLECRMSSQPLFSKRNSSSQMIDMVCRQ